MLSATGPRAVLSTMRPTIGKSIIQRADLLPLGPFRSLSLDGQAAFEEAVRGSLRLAVAESRPYDTSTIGAVGAAPLVYLKPFQDIESAVPGLPPETRRAWNALLDAYSSSRRFFPASGELLGMYVIHSGTGSALAVLPDGSGGGVTRSIIELDLQWSISLLNWTSAVGGTLGIIGLAGGAWIALEKAQAKKIIQATIAIDGLDAPTGATDLDDSIRDIACDILKGLAGEAFGRLARLRRPALQALGIVGGATITTDSFVEAATNRSIECF